MAMVSAVPVPSVAKESGTITKSEDAGVRQERVSRVPPTTPIDRLSLGASPAAASVSAPAAGTGCGSAAGVAEATGVEGVVVIRVPSCERPRCVPKRWCHEAERPGKRSRGAVAVSVTE
ncbi:hypothetical protein GCM10017688_59340 [Streptomyces ramulosus]